MLHSNVVSHWVNSVYHISLGKGHLTRGRDNSGVTQSQSEKGLLRTASFDWLCAPSELSLKRIDMTCGDFRVDPNQ